MSFVTWMRSVERAGMLEQWPHSVKRSEASFAMQRDRDGAFPVSPEASKVLEFPNTRKLREGLLGETCDV
jgi:hypothetical protein